MRVINLIILALSVTTVSLGQRTIDGAKPVNGLPADVSVGRTVDGTRPTSGLPIDVPPPGVNGYKPIGGVPVDPPPARGVVDGTKPTSGLPIDLPPPNVNGWGPVSGVPVDPPPLGGAVDGTRPVGGVPVEPTGTGRFIDGSRPIGGIPMDPPPVVGVPGGSAGTGGFPSLPDPDTPWRPTPPRIVEPPDVNFDLSLYQAGTGAPLVIRNLNGITGDYYVNLVSLVAVDFPNGPMFGIDLSLADALAQIAYGPPFFGTIGQGGWAQTVVPPPFAYGTSIYCVGIEVDCNCMQVVGASKPFAYKIL